MEHCNCGGGNAIEKFNALFTCSHSSCKNCHTGCHCCNPQDEDGSSDCTGSSCLNFYNISQIEVQPSTIKSFGFCQTGKNEDGEIVGALALIYVDGNKKMLLNVKKSDFIKLKELNVDRLSLFLSDTVDKQLNQCIFVN